MHTSTHSKTRPAAFIGETYTGSLRGQASLLAGFAASIASATVLVGFAAIALPGAFFA